MDAEHRDEANSEAHFRAILTLEELREKIVSSRYLRELEQFVILRMATLSSCQYDAPLHRIVKKGVVVDSRRDEEQDANDDMPNPKFTEQIRITKGHHWEVRPPISGEKLAAKAHSICSLHQSHCSAPVAGWKPIEELDHGESFDTREKEHARINCEDDAFVLFLYRLCRQLDVHAKKDKVNSDCRATYHQVYLRVKGIIGQVSEQKPAYDISITLNLLERCRLSYLYTCVVDLDKVEQVHASPSHQSDQRQPLQQTIANLDLVTLLFSV